MVEHRSKRLEFAEPQDDCCPETFQPKKIGEIKTGIC